jgi:hypothetical protein
MQRTEKYRVDNLFATSRNGLHNFSLDKKLTPCVDRLVKKRS